MSLKDATIQDIFKANKVLKKLKSDKVTLFYPDIGKITGVKIIGLSDTSFSNLKDGGSHGGYIIFLAGSNKFAPISWCSRKLKRIVRSTLAAETLAMQDMAENCFLIRNTLCELYEMNMNADVLLVSCITDSKHHFGYFKDYGVNNKGCNHISYD